MGIAWRPKLNDGRIYIILESVATTNYNLSSEL